MVKKKPSRPHQRGTKGRPVRLETHEELTARLPEIFRRLNENPEIGRLTLINPILALEDIGFTLSEELQDHLRKTLPFPKGRLKQITKARKRLRELLGTYTEAGKPVRIPKTPRERASLLFDKLGLPCKTEPADALTVQQLRAYRDQHPVVEALYEVGRLERGTLIFQSKGAYESHKAGLPHHPWLKRLHFPAGG